MVTCKICNKNTIKDLTNGLGSTRHYYCINCYSHYYRSVWYTKKQWEKYIEEDTRQRESQARILERNKDRFLY